MFKKSLYAFAYTIFVLCSATVFALAWAGIHYKELTVIPILIVPLVCCIILHSIVCRHPEITNTKDLNMLFPIVTKIDKKWHMFITVLAGASFCTLLFIWFYPQNCYANDLPLADNVLRYGYYISTKILAPLYAVPGGYSAVFWITAESTQHSDYETLMELTKMAQSLTQYKVAFWALLVLCGVCTTFAHRIMLYKHWYKVVKK